MQRGLDQKIRYLIAGVWNTAFAYVVGILLYKYLYELCGIWGVGILANVLGISMSFCAYKFFVFRSSANWVKEYAKSYLVYGFVALVNIPALWLMVDRLKFSIWLSQFACIIFSVIISYAAHSNFTFKKNEN